LLLDVGALYVNRRTAQNAADAGALAGARLKCSDGNYSDSDIEDEIRKYTEIENHATLIEWHFTNENVGVVAGLRKGEIVVTAAVTHESFFAKIFGEDTLSASATAGAGCFSYRPNVVLPIAWSCRPPAAGSASDDCDIVKVDYAVVENVLAMNPGNADAISDALYAIYSDKIYIVMDSDKECGDPTVDPLKINCDFLDDETDRNQLESGGSRGWLNLDGGPSSTAKLRDWVENGVSIALQPHTWLNSIPGEKEPGYTALSTRLDEIVWIPVFNMICDEDPRVKTTCMDKAHEETPPGVPLDPGQECIVIEGSSTQMYYHVVSFAPFMPTCVHSSPGDECPGFTLAQLNNPDPDKAGKYLIADNTNSFEGYFVDPETLGEDVSFGADLGIYTVSLTR